MIRLLTVCLLLILSVGCQKDFTVEPATKPNSTEAWVFSGPEIGNWLNAKVQEVGSFPEFSPQLDGKYFVLSYKSALDAISQYKFDTLGKPYIPNGRDCDDYAFGFKSFVHMNLSTKHKNLEASPAVAVLFVWQKEPFGGVDGYEFMTHVVVGIGTDKGVIILEPQTGIYCKLEDYPNKSGIYYILR